MFDLAFLVRFFIKLVMGISAAVLAIALLACAVVIFGLHWLTGLLTGRGSSNRVAFRYFQRAPYDAQGSVKRHHPAVVQMLDDVVDVQVREIPADSSR